MSTQLNQVSPETDAQAERTAGRAFWLMLALVAIAAAAVVTPFAFLGNASGHDFEVHLASWMDVATQWHSGVVYPRWAALANWGFGEPRFIFYPPASWFLGAALSFVLPWRMVPGAFIWIALTLAGVSMFTLARQWLPARDATVAALLFALNPYHLVIVYWRSDFAELLASALIPLAVLFSMRMAAEPRSVTPASSPAGTAASRRRASFVPLALVTAAIWLSNAPAAVIVSYTMAMILVIVAVHRRSVRPLLYGAGSLALGLAVGGFYIVPAAFEQQWVNIGEVIGQGLAFPENFLFTRTADLEHTRFNVIVSWTAVEVIGATVVAVIATASWRRERPELWWVLTGIALASSLLMLPVSFVVWQYLPKLRYVQFPWRWLLVLDAPFAFCLAAAMGRLRALLRHAAWAMALVALAITGVLLTRTNWWEAGGADDFFETHFATGNGYFGLDEYGPRGSDHNNLQQHAPRISVRTGESAVSQPKEAIQVQRWGPARMVFTIRSSEPVTAAPRLLNYPAWRVEVNGVRVSAKSDPNTGQILVPLPAGTNHVQIRWVATPDVRWGEVVSAIAALTLLAIFFLQRRYSPACNCL